MGEFDFSNPAHLKARVYRTHAFSAELFAGTSARPANAETWAYIARAWTELAGIKERCSESPPHWPHG